MAIIIEIENPELIKNNFPKKSGMEGRWFTASQKALMFKENEKYPHHFELSLAFSDNESEVESAKPISVGRYEFSDDAFYIDNRNHCQIDPMKLRLHVKK